MEMIKKQWHNNKTYEKITYLMSTKLLNIN